VLRAAFMEQKNYPLLRDSVRIKKMPAACWTVDATSDNGTIIHPLEAFQLSLCNGSYSVDTLKQIYAGTLRREKADISELVDKTLDKLNKYLEWRTEPVYVAQRYDPTDYLYDKNIERLVPEEQLEIPGEMVLVLTYVCNFKCIYCFDSSGKGYDNNLSTEEWMDVIEQAKKLDVVKCTLSGGEPMAHPGFFDILAKILNSGMLAYVCTNGNWIDKHSAKKFADMGLPGIQISLDAASSKMQDILTTVPGTFPNVINAIKQLVGLGIEVYVKAVLTLLNMDEAGELIDICHNLGVTTLILDCNDLSASGGKGGTGPLMSSEQLHMLEALIDVKKKEMDGVMGISLDTGSRCRMDKDDIALCGALRTSFIVLPNGEISVCEKLVDIPEMTAGNIREDTLEDIWTSLGDRNIFDLPSEKLDELCKSCEHLLNCRTGCFAQSLLVSKNPYSADPRCWKAEFTNTPYIGR
jgi:radical SAM protein with 4Fe4S-binding SPASM domain